MKNIIFKYGFIAGGIAGLLLFVSVMLYTNGTLDMKHGQWVGYGSMLVALVFVYFGVKQFRNIYSNGIITFKKAFTVGILISLVAAVTYALSWEIAHKTVATGFMDLMTQSYMDELRAGGATEEALTNAKQEMDGFVEMYKNPVVRFLLTVMEILPVGLVVSIFSAIVLKKKN